MNKENATLAQWLAAPHDFFHGLLGGLLGPLLALAGAIGILYLATGKLPAFKKVAKSDGSQHRALALESPLEARASWAKYGGEFRAMMLKFQARAQQTPEQ